MRYAFIRISSRVIRRSSVPRIREDARRIPMRQEGYRGIETNSFRALLQFDQDPMQSSAGKNPRHTTLSPNLSKLQYPDVETRPAEFEASKLETFFFFLVLYVEGNLFFYFLVYNVLIVDLFRLFIYLFVIIFLE